MANVTHNTPDLAWVRQGTVTILVCAIFTGVFVSYFVVYLFATVERAEPYPFGDFFSIWSYAKIALSHPATELYDPASLRAAQTTLGMPEDQYYLFAYPPTFLLYIWPLGQFSYNAAYVIWMSATLLFYVLAISIGGRTPPVVVLAALMAPTTTINIVAGQSGFLLAAFLIGGLRVMSSRPVLSGVLLGLATYKPQFGILLPIALVAARQWRCIAAACATTVVLVIITSATFSGTIWLAWLHAFPDAAAQFYKLLADNRLMPTVGGDLHALGIPQGAAYVIQVIVGCLAASLVFYSFRHLPSSLAISVFCAATFLATPYAFIYDLPILTGAVLLFVSYRISCNLPLGLPEIGLLILVMTFPAILAFGDIHAPISSLTVGLFIALTLMTQKGAPALLDRKAKLPRPL
jgi:alpha-1,2-mannosyltransferase